MDRGGTAARVGREGAQSWARRWRTVTWHRQSPHELCALGSVMGARVQVAAAPSGLASLALDPGQMRTQTRASENPALGWGLRQPHGRCLG